MLRIWVPADPAAPPSLRGVAQHVASGRSVVFSATDQLLAFLLARVADAAETAALEGADDA